MPGTEQTLSKSSLNAMTTTHTPGDSGGLPNACLRHFVQLMSDTCEDNEDEKCWENDYEALR